MRLQTGDIICTTLGGAGALGAFWFLIGKIIPGAVDHVAVYTGPGGRCVEAGARGRVVAFTIPDGSWDAGRMRAERGPLLDSFYGVAYPLAGRRLDFAAEQAIRVAVAAYCLAQAAGRKPYNLNFADSATGKRFYCSQLAYKAYLPHGIDLNTGAGVPHLPGTASVVFPQEIWSGCVHDRQRW